MSQHMGVASRETIYQLLWAADTFGKSRDPTYDINNYLIANNIFTPNIRNDSGQPDTWRDYQQILPELGLIVSTRAIDHIHLTPIALAFIDKSISFEELVTIQTLRYQYPNGYKTAVSSHLRKELANTRLASIETLTELHTLTGVRIRPAVLLWQILRMFLNEGIPPSISFREIDFFLLPAISHDLTQAAFKALLKHRKGGTRLSQQVLRTTQEWMRVLCLTPLFEKIGSTGIGISSFGLEVGSEVDKICERLVDDDTFWYPQPGDKKFMSWYSFFGSVDIRIGFTGHTMAPDEISDEGSDDVREFPTAGPNSINLRPFDADNLFDGGEEDEEGSNLVQSTYSRSITRGQHILHDRMVRQIAGVCSSNGGYVFDDPKSVDLLVQFESHDFIIEVKSVTPRNFVNRLRLALGQLLQYEYIRSGEIQRPIRKVIAFPARVYDHDWYVPFLNEFLDVDLLSLGDDGLRINSKSIVSKALFASNTQSASLCI